MASKIVKGLAIAAGVGLVIGLGSGKRRPEGHAMDMNLPEGLPSLEPVLERLDRIEGRISAVEERSSPASGVESDSMATLDERIERQAKEIEALQSQVNEHRQKVDGEIAAIEKRFADVTKAIPGVLESIIVPRVEDLRAHLRSETQQSINASLTKFERAMDDRVSERIDALEKALLNQSTIVTTLSQRSIETDMNMQRLISAVERLCERGSGATPGARQDSSLLELPFQKELNEAVKRQPEGAPAGFESAFRPRIVKEEDESGRRHRVPLTRL